MALKKIEINSEASAFAAIKQAMEEGFGGKDVRLDFKNWPHLEIELEGPGYKSTITSPLASAIVDVQTALNRSFALVVHGKNNASSLTDEERNAIQFKAKVEDGCTLIKIDLGKFAETLATAVTDKMTPEALVITVLGVAAMAAGVVAYKAFLKSRTADKTISADAEKLLGMSKEETARHKILADALSKSFELRGVNENFNEARNGILKGTSDALTLTVNNVAIDQETARVAVANIRAAGSDVQLNGTYFVTETNLRRPDEVRLSLRRAQDNKEFVASFQDQSLDGDQIKLLQAAEWGRSTVFLSINATELRGDITGARVISVQEQPPDLGKKKS